MLSPQNTPGESGDSWKAPSGVKGALTRQGSPGLFVVAGVIWRLGVASVPCGLPMASSQAASNILAMRCWPWV